MKPTPYYISIFNTYPWQSNAQYVIKCSTRTDAIEFAKLLSALNGVEARVSVSPGFRDSDTIVYAKYKKGEEVMRYDSIAHAAMVTFYPKGGEGTYLGTFYSPGHYLCSCDSTAYYTQAEGGTMINMQF